MIEIDIDVSTIAPRPAKIKKTTASTKKPAIRDIAVKDDTPVVSDFKSIRHLVEYYIVKDNNIKFSDIDKTIAKQFPNDKCDIGTFMWVKLEYVKHGTLEFKEEIDRQLLDESNKEAST